jgi:hypothetical protein
MAGDQSAMTNDLTKEELEEIARTGTASLRPWQMQLMAKQLLGCMEREVRLEAALEEIAVISIHRWDSMEEAKKDIHSGPFWERKLMEAIKISWKALCPEHYSSKHPSTKEIP